MSDPYINRIFNDTETILVNIIDDSIQILFIYKLILIKIIDTDFLKNQLVL
jgi:hypothetical protein